MKIINQMQHFRSYAFAVAAATCLWVLLAAPAQGALIMSINPSNSPVTVGSTGNFFDVVLTNTTAVIPGIAGFSLSLTAGSASLIFTNATTASPSYIFTGDSFDNDFNGNVIRTSPNGQTLLASDFTSSGNNVTLAGNSAVRLGRVFFSILDSASIGPISISIDKTAATSLSDASGALVALGTSANGTVTVVPEPATAGLLLLALSVLGLLRKRQ